MGMNYSQSCLSDPLLTIKLFAAGMSITLYISWLSFLSWVASLTRTSDDSLVSRAPGLSEGSRHLESMSNIVDIKSSLSVAQMLNIHYQTYIALNAVWAAANTSIKVSIVHFYITIFRSNKTFLRVAYAVITLILAFGVAVIPGNFLFCRPLSKAWNPLQPGVCGNPTQSLIAFSSVNMAIDLIIIILPVPMVWGLQMATWRKVKLTIIFALGSLYVCICIPLCSSRLTSLSTEYVSSP